MKVRNRISESTFAKWLILFFILFLCICEAGAEEKKLSIICSTTQIADFAKMVVGDRILVKGILAPGADPHTYMPTPDDAKTVIRSDLALENGMHLEGKNWMQTLARDANKPLVTCTSGIEPIQIEKEGERLADPHAWFSPKNVAIYINNITEAVIRMSPDNRHEFESRATLFLGQLRVLDGWIKRQVSRIPLEKRVLVTSHDAFNYFCREYKFNADHQFLSLAPVGWSTGSEVGAGMTPKRRKQVIDSIRKFGAKAVFVETSVNPKLIREIAREAGIQIGGSLYSDSMGEKDSAGETYIGMMRENVLVIVDALTR